MLSQNSRVSVITGTGNEGLTRFFGHLHIRISDPDNYIDAVLMAHLILTRLIRSEVCRRFRVLLWHLIIATYQ
jgi:hypothetical protein